MINGKPWILAGVLCVGAAGSFNRPSAQTADSDLPDAPSETVFHPHHGGDPASDRRVSWHSLPKDFLHDQKKIWLFPVQLAQGKHLVPTLAIAGGTAILLATDSHTMPYFGKHQGQLDDINDVFDSYITTGEVIAVPVPDARELSPARRLSSADGDPGRRGLRGFGDRRPGNEGCDP